MCQKWEEAALKFTSLGIRTVILRNGIILGKEGGMLQKLIPLAKWGLNVSLGSGKQYLPWMDVRDLVAFYGFILSHPHVTGIYNAVASQHITMNYFSKKLLQSFGKKCFLPNVPGFIIRLFLGEMSVMLLEGSRVSNEKMKASGFHFNYDTLEESFADLR